jgi:SAM-dependent MidA family methyltransferase
MRDFIRTLIKQQGPLPLDRYMALCLGHPQLGYYMRRDPFGAGGDFTTSPEISQIFGELVGIWCVAAWEAIGSPAPFLLVELGPGRGTLMADILRATARMADFQAALQVHLVETSPVLQAAQREKLGPAPSWHSSIATLPEQPLIFVANEFFDALPVRQVIRAGAAFAERHVALRGDELVLADLAVPRMDTPEGLCEIAAVSSAIAEDLGARIAALGGAGLVIDYGHLQSAPGDTLQALKGHRPVGILDFPGESDLTAHVDFARLAGAFAAGGAAALPAMTQGQFLNAMGLGQRLAALTPKLSGKAREDFIAGAKRLVDESAATAMGRLFKVLAVVQNAHQPVYPFEAT